MIHYITVYRVCQCQICKNFVFSPYMQKKVRAAHLFYVIFSFGQRTGGNSHASHIAHNRSRTRFFPRALRGYER